jgi:pimeloyl-ACP methyl ester carboxylesterase
VSPLVYERRGAGSPLVLIHTLGGNAVSWRPVVGVLAAERDVIAPDLPGFGRSPAPKGFVPSAANLATAVIELCTELGVRRPAVAGNSLGGWVALEMARRGEASAVVAISPAGLWREPLGPRRYSSYAVGRALRPLVWALLRTARGRALLLRSNIAHPERVPADDARSLVMGYLDSPGYRRASELMHTGVFDGAGEIDVPVTIAWGMEDRIVGRPSRTRWPIHGRYVEMEGWGHLPTWDDPEGVARLILEGTSDAAETRPS